MSRSRSRVTGHAHLDVTGLVLGLAGLAAETSAPAVDHHHYHCHHGCTGPCRHPSHRRGPRARPVVHHHHVHHAPPPPPVCVTTTTPVVALGCTTVVAPPPPPTGAYLRILSASYGCGQRRYDVTAVLQQLVFAQGGLSINAFGCRSSMNNQFGDPAHGSRKTLEFTYEIVGLPKTVVLKEDYKLNLDLTTSGCHGTQEAHHFNLVLLQASYGYGETRYDVTSILANMIAQQRGKQVSAFGYIFSPNGSMNQAFGDPVPGVDKDLRVVYQWRTPVLSCAVHEDQPVRLAYEALRSPLC